MEMEKQNKSTLHVNIDSDLLKRFDSLYPRCRRRFLQNALRVACQNRSDFDKIFFVDLLNGQANLV